jgi:POT family proton-dependent oligopeptide transporter
MHRNTIFAIIFLQLLAVVNYAIIYSTLSLYMTLNFEIKPSIVFATVSAFLIFNYSLHALGGYIGGKIVSYRVLFLICIFVQLLSGMLMIFQSIEFLYFGLTLFIVASGLGVPCTNIIVIKHVKDDKVLREKIFLWSYASTNIGFVLGYVISGYFQLKSNYQMMFISATGSNLLTLASLWFFWDFIDDINTDFSEISKTLTKKNLITRYLIILVIILLLYILIYYGLHHPFIIKYIALGFSLLLVFFFVVLALSQGTKMARNKIFIYLIMAFFSMFFWSIYFLAPMSLALFALHNVNLSIFVLSIAPQWLPNIEVAVISILGFLLNRIFARIRNCTPLTAPTLFAISILFIGLGYSLVSLGIYLSGDNGLSMVIWIALLYAFQGIGESVISPVGDAMIGDLAPKRHQGLMLGC